MIARTLTRRSVNISRYLCRILGVLFVVSAPFAFVSADTASRYHTLLHFVTGLVALYIGFRGTPNAARLYCLFFGGGYLALGALGVLFGDPRNDRLWSVGPLRLMLADHIFHLVLGAVILLAGVVTRIPRANRDIG